MANKHIVYLIRSGDFVKIGHTCNFEKRLTDMQTGSPHKLYVITTFPMESRMQARAFEKNLHYICRHGRFRGEWFHLSHVQKRMKESPEVQSQFISNLK